ncbi:MAG: outer membrane protein assembly factor BamE [Gammaproteobacteria bacterium]|nr:outer membrane protein assembly factor BamE [Gammaproteobacteria bacterium]
MNKLTLIVFSLPFLSACSPSMPELPDLPSLPSMSDIIPTPYKADIYQGSVLERFKINQLKVGMSKAQVKDLIGSPSVIDPFHNNQWDYINYSTPGVGSVIHYRLILAFDHSTLTKVDTTGIGSLPQLTDEEKALEDKRIAEEKARAEAAAKAKAEAERIAKEKAIAAAKAKAEAERIAKEKAAAKAKALENKRIAEEKAKVAAAAEAKAEKIAKEKEEAKAKAKALEDKRIAEEKAKAAAAAEAKRIEEANKPWYKFW